MNNYYVSGIKAKPYDFKEEGTGREVKGVSYKVYVLREASAEDGEAGMIPAEYNGTPEAISQFKGPGNYELTIGLKGEGRSAKAIVTGVKKLKEDAANS